MGDNSKRFNEQLDHKVKLLIIDSEIKNGDLLKSVFRNPLDTYYIYII